jgi:hypothetical protein
MASHSGSESHADTPAQPSASRGVSAPGIAASRPAWERLSEELGWYETKSAQHKRWFYWLKVIQIIVAAAIPVVAAAGASPAVAGALGGVIVVLEGLQQLFQFQQNWVAYRGTAEALKHEKNLYLVGAGDYADAERPDALLIERVEGLVSQEHAAWAASIRDQTAQVQQR